MKQRGPDFPRGLARLRRVDAAHAEMVAYLRSVTETRAVRQWAEGTWVPSTEVVNRLRTVYQITALLRQRESAAVVQAWFQGMSPQLDDVAPARLLREGDLSTVGPLVLAAARAFAVVVTGWF